MAIVSLNGPIFYPDMLAGVGCPPAINTTPRFNADPNKAQATFVIPKTGTLDKVEFYIQAIGTAHDVKVSFQDIDPATGNPDGTIDQYRVVPTASVVAGWCAPGLMTSDGTDSGTKRAVTIGDIVCVVWEYDSTAGDIRIGTLAKPNSGTMAPNGLAYTGTRSAAGVWTKNPVDVPILALKYNDGSYAYVGPFVWPIISVTTRTFNSGSTPDERGLYLSVPVAMSAAGAWVLGDWTGDATIKLYDTDGSTVIGSATIDKDNDQNATVSIIPFWFAAPVTLAAGSHYRLTVVPSSATNLSIYEANVNSAALMAGMAGGTDMIGTSRTDAGTWTNASTVRPIMGLVIAGIDVATGGGSTEHAWAFVG